MKLSIVIPAYNEEKRLPATLGRITDYLEIHFPNHEIIVVDDGSTDGTAAVVEAAIEHDKAIRLIRYMPNLGKGHAVKTGVLAARGSRVLVSDADLSTPIEEVEKLLPALADSAVAIGSRARRDARILAYQPWYRMALGKNFNRIVRLLAVRGISDTQCGFKCWRGDAAREVFSRTRISGFAFDVESLYIARKLGLEIREIGVDWRNDPESKVHPVFHSLQMFRELLTIRSFSLFGCYDESGPEPCAPMETGGVSANPESKAHQNY